MNKLGIKVVLSYVIISVITTVMFGIIIQKFIVKNIVNEKSVSIESISKLTSYTLKYLVEKEAGNKKVKPENVKFSVSDDGSTNIIVYGKTITLPIEKTTEVDTYIMDVNDVVYCPSGKNKTKNELINNSSKIFYHIEEIYIKDTHICSIITIAKDEYYYDLNNYINNEIYIGLMLSLLFSLIVALIFERKIIGPISLIRNNILNISLDDELYWSEVKTNDELQDIDHDLYEITKELRSSNKLQKEFFQNTSHELKTPLMSIRGYTEAIKDGILDESKVQNALDIIIDESNKLSDMISSILYLGMLEKYNRKTEKTERTENIEKTEKIEKINLRKEIEKFVNNKATIITEKNIVITNNIPENMFIFTEKEKVDRIISNLFSNAIRYTNTKVVADFYIKKDKIHFLVMDDGRGFINKENEKIFERFYKGDGGNSGLGLSIVKSIVKNWGGEIKAYNSHIGGAAIEIIVDMSDDIEFID